MGGGGGGGGGKKGPNKKGEKETPGPIGRSQKTYLFEKFLPSEEGREKKKDPKRKYRRSGKDPFFFSRKKRGRGTARGTKACRFLLFLQAWSANRLEGRSGKYRKFDKRKKSRGSDPYDM